jgi:hypothetical protein
MSRPSANSTKNAYTRTTSQTSQPSTASRMPISQYPLILGVVSKQQHLGTVRKLTSNPKVITRKIDPQRFRFYDGVALVTETDRPTTKDGTFAFQSTEVWVRRGDSWKLVHIHYSRIEEKP